MTTRHRIAAFGDLLGRYGRTFAHFWSIRSQMPTGLFREDEAQFLSAALSIQETPPSKTARLLGWLLSAMVLVAVVWSILGRMDIVVNAQGKVIPSQRVKTIAAVETGNVVRLDVEEGQHVKEGQLLIQLDTGVHDAERDKANGDQNEAILNWVRNQAFLDALDRRQAPSLPHLDEVNKTHGTSIAQDKWKATAEHALIQYQDYVAKSQKLADDVAHFSKALPIAEQQALIYQQLVATKDVSLVAWQEKEQARLQTQSQLTEARNQLASLTAESRKQAIDQIADARRQASESEEDVRRANSYRQLLAMKSPVDGTVQQLTVHTIGSAVQVAAPLMQIVPDGGALEVEAFIENKDKGFVHAGQDVAVKVDTFEYTKYGTLHGHVSHVSQDAIQDEKRGLIYSVKISLDKTSMNVDGTDSPVTPGMSVSVEIKTGNRRVIDYVLDPLLRHTHEAANER